jgi:hypothetical protein
MIELSQRVTDIINDKWFFSFSDLVFEQLTVEPIPEPISYTGPLKDHSYYLAVGKVINYHEQRKGE